MAGAEGDAGGPEIPLFRGCQRSSLRWAYSLDGLMPPLSQTCVRLAVP